MHYTYILLTENDTLYCGYSNNVEKRFLKHLSGKGAKYTKANKPVKIVYKKAFKTKSEALKEEARIKKLSKKEKLELIAQYSRRQGLFGFPVFQAFSVPLASVFRVLLILFLFAFLIAVIFFLLAAL